MKTLQELREDAGVARALDNNRFDSVWLSVQSCCRGLTIKGYQTPDDANVPLNELYTIAGIDVVAKELFDSIYGNSNTASEHTANIQQLKDTMDYLEYKVLEVTLKLLNPNTSSEELPLVGI